ncbi:unnamed protein product [Schistosoma turkestanicum]|nr:unnamed protein product [Schistosoma turkestanicum]
MKSMNMNLPSIRKDIAIQTDSASEYSSETDGSDESETNDYSGFNSNSISKLSTNSSSQVIQQSTMIELNDGNNNSNNKRVNASSHNLSGCEVNVPSFSVETTEQLIQQSQVHKSNMIVKSNSQQVYFNSSVDTHSINNHHTSNNINSNVTINHGNLTDCDKRNSSASLDSGRDSTYATGSEGSSGYEVHLHEMVYYQLEIIEKRLSGCLSKSGFDLWTLCHTTPEELNACGITNPYDRQILRSQLATLQLSDPFTEKQLPDNVYEWLVQLHLEQYWLKFNEQGLLTFEQIIRITWDDLEEIGISKLGHQKKLLIAINKLNRLLHHDQRLVCSPKIHFTTTPTNYNMNSSINNQSIDSTKKETGFVQSTSDSSFLQSSTHHNHNRSSSSTSSFQHQHDNDSMINRTNSKVSEIGIQVGEEEEDLTKSHNSHLSQWSSNSSSTSNSPYSLPPPIDFQDSPPKSLSSSIYDTDKLNSNLQQSHTSCIINEQFKSNLLSCTTITTTTTTDIATSSVVHQSSSHSLGHIHSPLNTKLTSNECFNNSECQIGKQCEPLNLFQRRSSNPTLYSLKPNDPIENIGDLSKWSSGFLTTPQLRLPVKVNSTSDPDLEAMHNIQVMLDQISERLILSNQ